MIRLRGAWQTFPVWGHCMMAGALGAVAAAMVAGLVSPLSLSGEKVHRAAGDGGPCQMGVVDRVSESARGHRDEFRE